MKLNNEKGLVWIRMQVFGGVAQRLTQTFSIRERIFLKLGSNIMLIWDGLGAARPG